MDDLRAQIKNEIKAQHRSVKEVAEAAGYYPGTIGRFLRGVSSIRSDALEDICQVLNCRLEVRREE